MVEGFYKAVVKELKAAGFSYDGNSKGSHERWVGPGGRVVIVPRNLYSRHTANGILRDAGVHHRF